MVSRSAECVSLVIAAAMILLSMALPCSAADETDLATFQRNVKPVLKKLCFDCHGPETQEAELRIDQLNPDLIAGNDAETWHDILNKLNLGEMPPEDAVPLTEAARSTLVGWLTTELQRVINVRRGNGGQTVLRRLTRYEYNYTMQDLLGVQMDFARDLPPESTSPAGFLNDGATLGISPLQIELYLAAARKGLARAIVSGDRPQVYTHRAEKSEKVRRVKGEVSSSLGYQDRFLVRMDEFPRQGEVVVRVTAGASAPADAPFPRMRVTMGVRADTRAPEMTLAEVDVTASPDDPATYELHGRIEDFPLPGHNPKYPGLQITIYHDPPGGASSSKGKGKKGDDDQPRITVASVEFEGPIIESWPTASHQQLLLTNETSADEIEHARKVLRRFLSRAYRRPATESDLKISLKAFEQLRAANLSFEETMREVMAMALISPDFLYLVEPRDNATGREQLSDHELAARLSYFLWSSMPDEHLSAVADEGKLRDDKVLAAEVRRMLSDPRSERFVQHFADQWFDLSAIDRVAVNPEYHPAFDDRLKSDMREETRLLLGTILKEDLSSLTLLDADFTFVNHRLAQHYGLEGPRGTAFQRVALTAEDRRGGVLTHGSFLLANSNGEDSHPIKRAVWLLDRLLDSPPPPPPPDVPDLDPDQADLRGIPLKQQLEVHRKKQACNSCHRGIDPWGIAFEHYDAVGRWREQVVTRNGKRKSTSPVDAEAELPDGTRVAGVEGLREHLLTEGRGQFAEATVRRLLTYALGRTLDISDQQHIDDLTADFARNDYRLGDLIVAIVRSEPFQTK